MSRSASESDRHVGARRETPISTRILTWILLLAALAWSASIVRSGFSHDDREVLSGELEARELGRELSDADSAKTERRPMTARDLSRKVVGRVACLADEEDFLRRCKVV